ncbi:hypothetical protein DYB28_010890, partial [Aphanomyces astaci]
DSLVISLQNGTYFSLSTTFVLMICDTGLGNVKILKDVLETDNVLHGVTYMGGVSIGPGSVIQGGAGTTIIQNAEHLSDSVQDTLGHLCTLLAASEIPSISILRWNESVVTGQDNLAIVEAIVNEVAAVANAQGITLNLHDQTPLAFTTAAAAATGANFCSMCVDIQRRKPTEIGSINDMIVAYGQQTGVPTPCNAFLTHVIKALERVSTLS